MGIPCVPSIHSTTHSCAPEREPGPSRCWWCTGLQLALVFRLIVMPSRLLDQAIGTHRPFLVPVHPNGPASASWAGVRTRPDPPEGCVTAIIPMDLIHLHQHVRKSRHESLDRCGNRRAADRGSAGVNG